jgi:hypothetical protein
LTYTALHYDPIQQKMFSHSKSRAWKCKDNARLNTSPIWINTRKQSKSEGRILERLLDDGPRRVETCCDTCAKKQTVKQ